MGTNARMHEDAIDDVARAIEDMMRDDGLTRVAAALRCGREIARGQWLSGEYPRRAYLARVRYELRGWLRDYP